MGRPLPYIQARLGHEDITTTVRVYGHLLPDAQIGDITAVESMLSIPGREIPVALEIEA